MPRLSSVARRLLISSNASFETPSSQMGLCLYPRFVQRVVWRTPRCTSAPEGRPKQYPSGPQHPTKPGMDASGVEASGGWTDLTRHGTADNHHQSHSGSQCGVPCRARVCSACPAAPSVRSWKTAGRENAPG